MIEFLRKFEKRDIQIARVNSILIIESINQELFTFILYGVLVCCDRKCSVHQHIHAYTYTNVCAHMYTSIGRPAIRHITTRHTVGAAT